MGPEREPERSGPATAGPAARANLNNLLKALVQQLLDKGPHAAFFRHAVSCAVIDDYRDHVPAEQDMYLIKILERTEAQLYADVPAFRADLQQMYDNAAAYNGRNGGKHAYEPVIHWAADMLDIADKELQQLSQALQDNAAQRSLPCGDSDKPDVHMAEAAGDLAAAPAAPATTNGPNTDSPLSATPSPPGMPLTTEPGEKAEPAPQPPRQQQQVPPPPQQGDGKPLSPVQEQPPPGTAAPRGQGSPRAANGSAGQQSSSPSSGSGDAAHSGLEALLAACELAAEQDSSAPRSGSGAAAAATTAAPERHSYPGCSGGAPTKPPVAQAAGGEVGTDAGAGSGPQSAARQQPAHEQPHQEDPAGSSEGGGMALCSVRGGGVEGVVSAAQPQPGAGGGGGAGPGGVGGVGGSYLASNAFKNRRHKSKVYIKPNKVVYLPTTFVEEEFDVTALPLDCELRVEADGQLTDESFRVTIKSVPRQGLSTMYCMTNVMRFQQQYLNWQIYNWTRVDNNHIKIHLQSPSPSQTQLQRPDLDRAASMPEVGRNMVICMRGSEDGGHARGVGVGVGVGATSSSLKRKSDTGRYNFAPRVERRLVPEAGSRDMPMELRLSSTGYLQYPSPIPESPPASPQRRVSACLAAAAAAAAGGQGGGASAALPPRGPSAQALGGGHHGRLSHQGGPSHPHNPPHQVHVHIHQHLPGAPYQGQAQLQHQQRLQQLYQPHPHAHAHQHLHGNPAGACGGPQSLALPFPLHQHQRGSNSSIKADQQTCSEDSSGPMAGADAASMPLPLTWHPAAGVRPGARLAAVGGPRGPVPAGGCASALHSLEPHQQIQELAEQLQLQAQAAGSELAPLTALQLAMTALQQQHQQQLLAAPSLLRGGGADAAPLDLSNPADQERLLQHLVGAGVGLGGAALHAHPHCQVQLPHPHLHSQPQPHGHHRAHRASGGATLLELDVAVDPHALASSSGRRSGSGDGVAGLGAPQDGGDYGAAANAGAGLPRGGSAQRGMSNSGAAADPYSHMHTQTQQQPPSGSLHFSEQQQRRSSHGDRCRQQGTVAAGFEDEQAGADAACANAAVEEGQQRGGLAEVMEEGEEVQHIVCHPRRSGNGGGAGKMFHGAAAAAGGRILVEMAPLGGASAVGGGRASGSGRRCDTSQQHQQGGGVGLTMGMGMAAFPPGIELAACNPADIFYLSPNKRFKIAVSAESAAAAALGSGELSMLDVLGLRGAAGGLGTPAEAALAAALRQGGSGGAVGGGAFQQAAAAAALGGRPFLPVGSEILGQLM